MEYKMFCYQCQETAGCTGCTQAGVCGKKPDLAAMQDLLIYVTKGISAVTTALRKEGKAVAASTDHRISVNLFTTITNANFDKEAIVLRIRETLALKKNCSHSFLTPPFSRTRRSGMEKSRNTRQKPLPSVSLRPKMRTSAVCAN